MRDFSFPHPSLQTIPCRPPAGEGSQLLCPCGMSIPDEAIQYCPGLDCPAFLQIDDNRGLCGMVPGMLDYVLRMVTP